MATAWEAGKAYGTDWKRLHRYLRFIVRADRLRGAVPSDSAGVDCVYIGLLTGEAIFLSSQHKLLRIAPQFGSVSVLLIAGAVTFHKSHFYSIAPSREIVLSQSIIHLNACAKIILNYIINT